MFAKSYVSLSASSGSCIGLARYMLDCSKLEMWNAGCFLILFGMTLIVDAHAKLARCIVENQTAWNCLRCNISKGKTQRQRGQVQTFSHCAVIILGGWRNDCPMTSCWLVDCVG